MEHSRTPLYLGAALSLVAALIHFWVVPEHFEEWWGYGMFFLISAIAQALYSVILPLYPRQPLLALGIAGNLLIILIWVTSRTMGIPLFGPHAGEVEEVGGLDLAATLAELLLVLVLLGLSWGSRARRSAGMSRQEP